MSKEAPKLMDAVLLVDLNVENPITKRWLNLRQHDRVKVFQTSDGLFLDTDHDMQIEVFKEEISLVV